MKNKKLFLISLIMLLIVVWIINDKLLYKEYDFSKQFEYNYLDKKATIVLEDCRDLYDLYIEDSNNQILNSVNIINMLDYLLYESKISISVYHDILNTMLSIDGMKNFDISKKQKYELEKFMTRKRKTGIIYQKYIVSKPVINETNEERTAYVIVIKYFNTGTEYFKYEFVKEGQAWKYKGFSNIDGVRIVVDDE